MQFTVIETFEGVLKDNAIRRCREMRAIVGGGRVGIGEGDLEMETYQRYVVWKNEL